MYLKDIFFISLELLSLIEAIAGIPHPPNVSYVINHSILCPCQSILHSASNGVCSAGYGGREVGK